MRGVAGSSTRWGCSLQCTRLATASSPWVGSRLHLREVSQQRARVSERAVGMQLELGREQRAYTWPHAL